MLSRQRMKKIFHPRNLKAFFAAVFWILALLQLYYTKTKNQRIKSETPWCHLLHLNNILFTFMKLMKNYLSPSLTSSSQNCHDISERESYWDIAVVKDRCTFTWWKTEQALQEKWLTSRLSSSDSYHNF